ncbi:hypothetical protein KBB96_00520 [Luteolibacter ambystomatis]|uniref:Uncharacterized protein n=1 Tax=Luteolibacter ambystomatis TaxID=2824561 RepID=A0A975G9L6_9BACT|nr:hypothetical protein [Luteolibacter ambystomatis]QUE51397.1 hypothetical protein KBB96_00520 [Luteolibacter ambystomatis]
MKIRPLVLAALAAFTPVVRAADAAVETAPAETEKLPGLPWHMVNLWWHTKGEVRDFSEFSVDIDISTDIPADQYNLYISPFCGSINGSMIYGGIQTNCNGWDAMQPGDHKRLHGGHGFIFSRWSDKPDLTLADVRATPGGFVEAADYEGNFVSGRRPYPWTAGKYTFSLRRLDTQITDGKPFTWVGAFVHEHATHKDVFVNALRFPGDKLVHNGRNAAFLEFYSTEKLHKRPDIAALPPLEVKFSNLRFNGAPADLSKVDTAFIRQQMKRSDGLGAPISPNLMRVSSSEDGREITCRLQNKIFPDAEEPNRTLWPVKK